ncbi:MAG: hypothetical protein ABJH04_10180 [Cyclobacteriaceae bacterium]
MFGFFTNKSPEVAISDQVWMSQQSKWKACLKMTEANNQCVFVAWFSNTIEELTAFLAAYNVEASIVLASDITSSDHELLIFVEHYPLAEVEQALFLKLNLNKVPVLSSLDEPLFSMFGGEKTIQLMQKLGMKEDEIVSHPMITKSIRSAQQKIAKKVAVEIKAPSQKDWLKKNVK